MHYAEQIGIIVYNSLDSVLCLYAAHYMFSFFKYLWNLTSRVN